MRIRYALAILAIVTVIGSLGLAQTQPAATQAVGRRGRHIRRIATRPDICMAVRQAGRR